MPASVNWSLARNVSISATTTRSPSSVKSMNQLPNSRRALSESTAPWTSKGGVMAGAYVRKVRDAKASLSERGRNKFGRPGIVAGRRCGHAHLRGGALRPIPVVRPYLGNARARRGRHNLRHEKRVVVNVRTIVARVDHHHGRRSAARSRPGWGGLHPHPLSAVGSSRRPICSWSLCWVTAAGGGGGGWGWGVGGGCGRSVCLG